MLTVRFATIFMLILTVYMSYIVIYLTMMTSPKVHIIKTSSRRVIAHIDMQAKASTTTTTPASTTAPFNFNYEAADVRAILTERHDHLEKACNRHLRHPANDSTRFTDALISFVRDRALRQSFYFDEVHKILVCLIPGVASTNLKKMLMYIGRGNAPFISPDSISAEMAHNISAWPSDLSFKSMSQVKDLKNKLKKLLMFTKIIWVKNPLALAISEWKSELEVVNQNMAERNGNNESISFDDFLRHQLMNEDRLLYHSQCLPCSISYNYIVHLENWYPETDFIVKNRILDQRSVDYEATLNNLTAQLEDYQPSLHDKEQLKQVLHSAPTELLQYVQKSFLLDFSLFSYEPLL